MILTVTMLSDWHVGSGTGRPGSVDRLIQKDTEGLPYIPAKTLTGILRDGCELVATGLDEGDSGDWHDCLEYLFGSQPALADLDGGLQPPIPAALAIRSAHLPASLRSALQGRTELKSAMTFVKPGVKIDDQTGTAELNCLRFEEMARSGCTLEAEYRLDLAALAEDSQKSVVALLVAGSAMTERLGAKRRRGAGKCQVSWSGLSLNLKEAIEHLTNCAPPQWPAKIKPLSVSIQPPQAQSTPWQSFELEFVTNSPIIIHDCTLGNLVKTLDYIPGTYLLPIVAKALAPLIDVGSAIGNGQLIISNATIAIADQRSLPMPFAFFKEKQDENQIYNQLCNQNNLSNQQTHQLKGMRNGYLDQSGNYRTIETTINTHNTIDDQQQRPNELVGGVYSYEAIEAGIKFRSTVRIQDPSLSTADALVALNKLLSKSIQIGRSKKDDYGVIKFLSIQASPTAKSERPNIAADQKLQVWLLSDVLVRDDRLRPSTNPQDLLRLLESELGVKLEFSDKPSFARSRRTDSWQTRWNLPRPSLVGFQAGSCFAFITKEPVSAAILQQLEQSGIGERRAEGYGQLCFNYDLLMKPRPTLTKDDEDAPPQPLANQIDEQQQAYAQVIQKAAWRSAIQRRSASLNAQERQKLIGVNIEKSEPSMSQLSNLRSIVMGRAAQNLAADAASWMAEIPSSIRDKWPDKMAAVEKLLTDATQIWQILAIDQELQKLTITNNGLELMKTELWAETIRMAVIDSIRSHKRAIEKTRGEQHG